MSLDVATVVPFRVPDQQHTEPLGQLAQVAAGCVPNSGRIPRDGNSNGEYCYMRGARRPT